MARRAKCDVERVVGDRIERNCLQCGFWKGLWAFSAKTMNGVKYSSSRCLACKRNANLRQTLDKREAKWIAARRAAWLSQVVEV